MGFNTLTFVILHLPTQSVSALVQPLGVCAEYLNPNIVQVSSHKPAVTRMFLYGALW